MSKEDLKEEAFKLANNVGQLITEHGVAVGALKSIDEALQKRTDCNFEEVTSEIRAAVEWWKTYGTKHEYDRKSS